MPYPTLESLPDGVKNVLPASAQEIWRKAFNSTLESTKDEDKARQAGWGAVKNAGWKKEGDKWVKSNVQNIQTHSFPAEIFSVGTWNGDEYSLKNLKDMVSNFNALKETIKPPVKLGHNNKGINKKISDGQPSLGWVDSLKLVGSKLIANLTNVPDIVYKAIKSGRYKRVSSEIYFNFKTKAGDIYSHVLKGVALLGADIPAVENLADLEAYLTQTPSYEGSFDKAVTYTFDVDVEGQILSEGGHKNMDEVKELTEQLGQKDKIISTKDDQIAEATKTLAEKEEAFKKHAEELKSYKEKVEAMEKKETDEKKTGHKKDIIDFCEEQVKVFKMTPAARDTIVKGLEEGKHSYSIESGFSICWEDFKTFMEGQIELLNKGEKASGKKKDKEEGEYKDISDEVDQKAKAFILTQKEAGKEVNYSEAVKFVLEGDADLAEAYVNSEERGE